MTIELPRADRPDVSVIVLAWRAAGHLRRCLTALAAQVGAPPFEVVVVENGATDEVLGVLDDVSGAVRVTFAENRGFGGGCAGGASVSRGRALAFLNDDAEPRPEWIGALWGRFRRDDRPVAVTSTVLDRDGSVQELGSRVLADAGTQQWGRGLTLERARDAGLLEDRAVDYGSAAALLVDRAAYDAVGGFDELYFPAYYEDVDLQLRLRLLGRHVVLEPSAVVVHTSGASTDAVPRYRQFLGERNGRLFRTRWADALAGAPSPGDGPERLLPLAPPGPVEAPPPVEPEVHAALLTEYLAWALQQADRAERAEADLAHRFADLQREHHESQQHRHELHGRVQALEAEIARRDAEGLVARLRRRSP